MKNDHLEVIFQGLSEETCKVSGAPTEMFQHNGSGHSALNQFDELLLKCFDCIKLETFASKMHFNHKKIHSIETML